VIVALVRGRPTRFAWLMLPPLLILGGEPSGAIVFLLVAGCAR